MAPSTSPQADQLDVSIEDLFTSINRHVQRSEYEKVVQVADQVLTIAPGDEDALRCKIVALIKADNIDIALSTIQASENLMIDFSFYKAYCLYRQNKLDEALSSLTSQERTSATMQLESQILYRLGKMDACIDVYQMLQKFKIESLEINIVACLISAGRAFDVQGMMDALKVEPNSCFELAYNTACSLIERREYREAEQYLLLAKRIGQETLRGNAYNVWTEEDIEIELAPIAVQLAYVRQLLGHTQEAMEAYMDIINGNLADDLSLAVAINNLISLKGPKEVSDGLRKLDKIIEKSSTTHSFQLARGLEKLSLKQREAIYCNRLLLLLHANRMDQARELVAALSDMFPDSEILALLQAAVLVRDNKATQAEEILFQFADRFPEKSKVVFLVRAQVAAAAGHLQIAADSLAKIPDIQHMPATVATLVSLKERAGDIDGALTALDSAINWWSNAMNEDNKLDLIMHKAASFKLKHGLEEEAACLYEDLVKSHGSVEALVGLVATAARVDVKKAEAYEKQLKPLSGLKEVDVDALEKTSGAKHVENDVPVQNVEVHEEATAARVDVKKAEAYEKQLKPLSGLKEVDVDALEKTSGAKHVENDVPVQNVEAYEKQLKPLSGLKEVDVDALEKTSGAKHVENDVPVQNVEVHEEAKGKATKAKKKRTRKPKYPKGFDPANPGPTPDPERWLPKRERSSFRPKRKDKRVVQVRGSQGAVVRQKQETNAVSTSTSTSQQKTNQTTTTSKPRSEQCKPSSAKLSKKKSRR